LSLTSGRIAKAPNNALKHYFQQATRFSSAFALLSDMSMLVLGGSLKRRERISARLGDILSYLYLLSAVLKHYQDQGSHDDDLPLVDWTAEYCLYHIQMSFDDLLRNFPNRWLALLLRAMIFPYGKNFKKPSDNLGNQVAQLLLSPTPTRERLSDGVFATNVKGNMMALLEDALLKSIAAEPIEKTIKSSIHDKVVRGSTIDEQAKTAYEEKVISKRELDIVLEAEEARRKAVAVDDFAPEELERITVKKSAKGIYAAHSTD
jgi:acyl-CoA dehydrogenase